MKKPVAIDLFCGGGAVTQGLIEAGFRVFGIDKVKPADYPGEFFARDLNEIKFSSKKGSTRIDDGMRPWIYKLGPPIDFVWASPPCQAFSVATNAFNSKGKDKKEEHINLIPLARDLIKQINPKFWVIENVPPAPIAKDYTLTGPVFGLNRIVRKRVFEVSDSFIFCKDPLKQPEYEDTFQCEEWEKIMISKCMGLHRSKDKQKIKDARIAMGLTITPTLKERKEAMGIKHNMTAAEVGEAVPPAYARFFAEYAKKNLSS